MNLVIAPRSDNTFASLKLGPIIDDDSQAMVIPSSGIITLKNDSLTILNAQSITVSASGDCYYSFTAGQVTTMLANIPSYDLCADLVFTLGTTKYYRKQYYDLLPAPLITNISDNDLIAMLPILERYRTVYTGRAYSGTTIKLVDPSRAEFTNHFVGAILVINNGSNRGWKRYITAHDGNTGEITVNKAFPYAFAVGDLYEIHAGWKEVRDTAWREIVRMLIGIYGRRIGQAIIDPTDYSDAHKYLCLKIICEQRIEQEKDQFWLWARDFGAKYESIVQRERVKMHDLSDVFESEDWSGEDDPMHSSSRPLRVWAR